MHDRSGEEIHIACDEYGQVLADQSAAQRAASQLYQYANYDVIENNCHRFVWNCYSGNNERLTRFVDLNESLSRFFNSRLSWQRLDW